VSTQDTVVEQLRLLHEEYTFKVNQVLDEGREDLARELSAAHADESLLIMLEGGRAAA